MEGSTKPNKEQGNPILSENNSKNSNLSSQEHSIKANSEENPRKASVTSINSTCYNSTGTYMNSPFCNITTDSQTINININQNGFLLYHYNQSKIDKLKNDFQSKQFYFTEQYFSEPKNSHQEIEEKEKRDISLKQNQQIIKKDILKKQKISSLDLLIEAADKLLKNGLNLRNLHSNKKMLLKKIKKKSSSQTINLTEKKIETFKCGNKICPEIVSKKSNLFYVTIYSAKKSIYLCNFCYQAFKSGQYCYYCGIIYRKYKGTKGFNNHMTWIGCEFCSNWVHIQCEETNGVYKNLSKIIKKDKDFLYKCPNCRKKNESKNQNKDNFGKEKKNFYTKRKTKKKLSFDENSFEFDEKYKHIRVDDEKKERLNDIKLLMSLDN